MTITSALVSVMALFVILSPPAVGVYFLGVCIFRNKTETLRAFQMLLIVAGTFLVVKGVYENSVVTVLSMIHIPEHRTLLRLMTSDPLSAGIVLAGAGILDILLEGERADKKILKREERKDRKYFGKPVRLGDRIIPTTSQLIAGISGAGKTCFLSFMAYRIAADEENIQIYVDGKGDVGERSLYQNLLFTSKKYGREMFVINCTANGTIPSIIYDFLSSAKTAAQATSMIMAFLQDDTVVESSGSQHYRMLSESYFNRLFSLALAYQIPLSFQNAILLADPKNTKAILQKYGVPEKELANIRSFQDEVWEDVKSSYYKLQTFLVEGAGRSIFTKVSDTDPRKRMNITQADEHPGCIFLVLADEMSMPSLVQSLVNVVSLDIRSLVAKRLTSNKPLVNKVYISFDEYSSYTNSLPVIQSIFSRARSAGCMVSLASQSLGDITSVFTEEGLDKLVNTAGRLVIFRQQGSLSPSRAAEFFGTRLEITKTEKTVGTMLLGQGSSTPSRRFNVEPDFFKNLPVNTGFMLTKNDDEKIIYFENEFLPEQ